MASSQPVLQHLTHGLITSFVCVRGVLTSSWLPPTQRFGTVVQTAGDEGATAVAHVLKDMRNLQVLAQTRLRV